MKRTLADSPPAPVVSPSSPLWQLPELITLVVLHAIEYSLLDNEQLQSLLQYRSVAQTWATDVVNASLLSRVRRWAHQTMCSILFYTAKPIFAWPQEGAGRAAFLEHAVRLFAGCESLCVCHHRVPLWQTDIVLRLPRLHSLWLEVTTEWPAAWSGEALPALRRLALNSRADLSTLTLPPQLETLWVLAWPLSDVGAMGVHELRYLKHYIGPHRIMRLFEMTHYNHCMPKTVGARPLDMKHFIDGGNVLPSPPP